MKMIGLAIIVAVIVEALIEYGQTVYDMIGDEEYKKAIKQGLAIIIAILFAFELKVTLLAWLITGSFEGVTVNPIFDCIVSGIFMSRGANYLSDFVRMIFKIGTHDDMWDDFDFEDEEDDDELTDEGEEE